jgi:hypothetical protein
LTHVQHERTPLQDIIPGSHTKRLGVLGFDKGASHYKKKFPHT